MGAVLDALRGVRWTARRRVRGGPTGAHRARTRGVSVEFTEYRAYRQGDETRRLDWKVLARTDRAYVRLTEDHAVLRTTVVVDASASMAYPTDTLAKWTHAARIGGGLAAVAHATGDPVGLSLTDGRAIPPQTRRGIIGDLVEMLAAVTPIGTEPLAPLLQGLRGRVVIISDFLGDADAVVAASSAHVARGGEVIAVHVIDSSEHDPPPAMRLVSDPEAPEVRRPFSPVARAEFQLAFAAWRATIADAWHGVGIDYFETVSGAGGEPADRVVRRIVLGRRREQAR